MKEKHSFMLSLMLIATALVILVPHQQHAVVHSHANHSPTINLYISQSGGSDFNYGNSTGSPFLTVSKAALWIQNYKNSQQTENTTFIVNIDDGRYFVNSTTTIVKSNKFNDKYSPVYWKPLKLGGQVTFTGGVPLPIELWSILTNQDLYFDMLPSNAKGNVMKLNLTSVGFTSNQIIPLKSSGFAVGSGSSGNELFFKRKSQTIARFPNKLTATPPAADDSETAPSLDVYLKFQTTDGNLNFTFNATTSPNRFNWLKELHPHAFSYWFHDWADGLYPLKSISQIGVGELNSKPGYGIKVGQRFFLTNFLSELDTPGEYVILDGVVYFWPPEPITKHDDVVISVSENLWDVQANAQRISNINFEMCRGIAISANSLRDTMVNFTTISNVGNRAISMSGCFDNCQAVSNIIYESGQGGISIGGGSRTTLTPSNALIMNNTIFNYTRIGKTYRPAISVDGVGVTVRNNELYNADHVAILWGGNNHDFAFNTIHDVCTSTGDSGAIYSGRDWTMRGNTIRYNYIYNVRGPGALGTTCIYLDDQFSSVSMYGNILVDCYRGLLLGGGRDNLIYGNVFVNNSNAILADDRGMTWADTSEINLRLKAVPYNTSTIWISSYPELPNILNDEPNAPKGNIVKFNVFVGKTSNSIYANFIKYSQYLNNTLDVKPETIFVHSQQHQLKGNFTIKQEASTSLLMNTVIPFSNIGLLPSETSVVTPSTSSSILQPSSSKNGTVVSQGTTNQQYLNVSYLIMILIVMMIQCLVY